MMTVATTPEVALRAAMARRNMRSVRPESSPQVATRWWREPGAMGRREMASSTTGGTPHE